MSTPIRVGDAMSVGAGMLKQAGVPDPQLDARVLMSAALGVDPGRVVLQLHDPLSTVEEAVFFGDISLRAQRIPVSQILGYRQFYGRRFEVTSDVLDPRPDTETLIELALSEPFSQVLDLGTGSGCIPISLLAERPGATGIATDISPAALEVARWNAEKIGVADRLHFETSDWFGAVGGTYDLIVSNPPYVSEADYAGLSPEVHHEPKIAVTPGGDGLGPYRIIARDAPDHLVPGGWLLVEIGYDQGRAVSELFQASDLEDVQVHPDLNGKDRVVSARARGI